ncbi:MAG: MMPL family transporter [Myxococcales bacterium]
MLDELGGWIYRHRFLTLGLAGLCLLLSVLGLARGGQLVSGSIAGLEADRAQALVDQVSGEPQDETFVAVFSARGLDPDDEPFQRAMAAALAPLRRDPRVARVTSPDEAPAAIALGMTNGLTHAAIAFVTLRGGFRQALAAYPQVRAELTSPVLGIDCTGRLPFTDDLNRTLEHDLLRAELVSLPLALLILLLVFRSIVAALLPVAVGGLAVVGSIAVVLQLSWFTDIAQYTVNVCSLIGLGVAIDYSLFTVSRYREELAAGHGTEEALRRGMARSGRVVAFSGAAVATGLAGLLFFEHSYLWAMGVGGAVVVALSVLYALTFLPALLAVLGPRLEAGRASLSNVGGGFWHRTATQVMRHPVAVLLPTLGLLAVMAVPFWHLRMAVADVTVLPGRVEARRGYEALVRGFPEEAESRIEVAVEFPTAPALTPARIGALYDLARRLGGLPGVTRVESLFQGPFDRAGWQRTLANPPPELRQTLEDAEKLLVAGRVVVLYALTGARPQAEAARALIERIRSERSVADGRLWVGGQTALDVDTTRYIAARTPRAVAFVVAVTLLVLFLLLGSVVLPLKAVVMNFCSIAGSFGALVWVFQDGHLWIREPRPVEPSLPILLFCALFGLSMDYEVLMLSRIKEAWERTGENTAAVAEGLERTAGLITSAAAIMVAVFGAFALASVVVIQAVGVGMALAVALDATAVRILLVPATMRLFGDLNWWAPRPLLRLRAALRGKGS